MSDSDNKKNSGDAVDIVPGDARRIPTWAVVLPLLVAVAGLYLLLAHGARIRRGMDRTFTTEKYAPAEPAPIETIALPPPLPTDKPIVSIVIDDLGYDIPAVERLLALRVPMTFAVLPGRPHSDEAAALVIREGRELILHQPMEALSQLQPAWPGGPAMVPAKPDPGEGAVSLSMGNAAIEYAVMENLNHFTGLSGMNNHMGSAFTRDPVKMEAALRPLLARGYFFLDSRTVPDSVAYEAARRLGIRSVLRDVFLDHEQNVEAIRKQLNSLLALARQRGRALAIGHPHPETVQVLEEILPTLEGRGFRMVPAGALARRAAPPLQEAATALP